MAATSGHASVHPMLRARNCGDAPLRRVVPGHEVLRRAWQFGKMMEISEPMEGGITYVLPPTLYAGKEAAQA